MHCIEQSPENHQRFTVSISFVFEVKQLFALHKGAKFAFCAKWHSLKALRLYAVGHFYNPFTEAPKSSFFVSCQKGEGKIEENTSKIELKFLTLVDFKFPALAIRANHFK